MSTELDRLQAALADSYTIERELGRGGMATVYLAEDLKHKRKVAVKVLRADLAAMLGPERFLKEVEVTAGLQHPNILPLYDSGQADDTLYYVMPYLEGESLRQRLDRERQLPVDEAVEIATSIAMALQFAHERQVVHRDIKPENVLFQAGQAIVADFGIALALSQATDSRMTETGLSLGTTRYMSPEQATGSLNLDARSDVYSLGALTYEMLTGDPPHTGTTSQALVAKIITETPAPIGQTRSMVPENVDAAVQVALAKAPADRFTSAERFARALSDPTFTLPTGALQQPVPGRASRFGWPAAALLLLVALLWNVLSSPDPEPAQVVHAPLSLAPGQALGASGGLGFARDGSFFIYPGLSEEGGLLWVRHLDEPNARPIPGSEGGVSPRVSPDGERVSFSVWDGTDWNLYVASLTDGTVRRLTTLLYGEVVDWGPGDQLYFQGRTALLRIAATGGEPVAVATPDTARGEYSFSRPHVLPNGRGVLMTTVGSAEISVLDLRSMEILRLGLQGSVPQYLPGYVVYRYNEEGEPKFFAIPFDADRLEVTRDPRPLPFVPRTGSFGMIHAAVSPRGDLVYVSTDRRQTELVWVMRDGTEQVVDPDGDGVLTAPRISPDGTTIVGELLGTDGEVSIATKSVEGGPLRPVSFNVTGPTRPEWHPDGTRVTFADLGKQQLVAPTDGRPPTPVDSGLETRRAVWSPDGQWMVLTTPGGFQRADSLFLQHTHPDSTARILGTSLRSPGFSPDGRYIAFAELSGGVSSVIVRPFPNFDDDRVQITFDGGYSPVWSPNGSELFYRDRAGRMFAAQVETEGAFRVSGIEPLFAGARYDFSTSDRRFDVHPDGERFLMVRRSGDELVLIRNWIEELRAFMGDSR